MAKRCTGWRSAGYSPHSGQGHVPFGTDGGHACRKCWTPCKNKADGGSYCSDCLTRLSTDPRPIVRRSLAQDNQAPDETIAFLTTDGDETVAIVARAELDRRGVSAFNATPTRGEQKKDDPWA